MPAFSFSLEGFMMQAFERSESLATRLELIVYDDNVATVFSTPSSSTLRRSVSTHDATHRTFSTSPRKQPPVQFKFGPYVIKQSEVFVETTLSFASVNLRPIVPGDHPKARKFRTSSLGHVLICPKRSVARYSELTQEEVADLWLLTQEVGKKVERHYGAEALSLCIQDGPAAGQTVPHVHIHCLPRKKGDLDDNDEVYDRLEETSQARTRSRWFQVFSPLKWWEIVSV